MWENNRCPFISTHSVYKATVQRSFRSFVNSITSSWVYIYPAACQQYGGLVGGWCGRQTRLTAAICRGLFRNTHMDMYSMGRVQLWRFCLIKYEHIGFFWLINRDIPRHISAVKNINVVLPPYCDFSSVFSRKEIASVSVLAWTIAMANRFENLQNTRVPLPYCANCQHDLSTEIIILDKRDFARYAICHQPHKLWSAISWLMENVFLW